MKRLNIIIITGLSGSGKSTAVSAFEDAGYYCVDNMPVELLPKFLDLPIKNSSDLSGIGFVMDLREKEFLSKYPGVLKELNEKGYKHEIIFLEADEEVLLRRFSQTRRQHPLSPTDNLVDSLRMEKDKLSDLRKAAHRIIDTSNYDFHKLKSVMSSIAKKNRPGDTLRLNIMSFGFKYGIPQDADLIVDVRFLKNPYFIPELKPLSGLNNEVRHYVLSNEHTGIFLEKYLDLLDFLVPLYKKEGKSYLTIAVGCTGGRHRSVVVSGAVYDHFIQTEKNICITHRDINL